MSLFNRVTTWVAQQILTSASLNGEFNNLVNGLNNLDGGTTAWTNVKTGTLTVTGASTFASFATALFAYRRPVLQFGSITTVAVQSGQDGTSGDIPVMFPDGSLRTETSTTHTTFDITRNAVLSGSAQSGLRTSLSEATNTWYALYAVKVTDTTTTWVTVGDTLLPIQANFASLNSNFGVNGWSYLGLIRNGDNGGATGDIISFVQTGNFTQFYNANAGAINVAMPGTVLNSTAGATSLTYTYSAGTGTTAIPNNIGNYVVEVDYGAIASQTVTLGTTAGGILKKDFNNNATGVIAAIWPGGQSVKITPGSSTGLTIMLSGFFDTSLGIGTNPLL